MTQINPNINQYNNQQYRKEQNRVPQQQPVKIPSYYYVPENSLMHKGIKEAIKDSDPMGVLTPFVDHPLLVLATWLGIGAGIDAYSKACGGKYEKSLVKKVANFGDNIQNSLFIQNKPVQTVLGGLKSVKKTGSKIVQNSGILRAMRDTPSMPEWSMTVSQMYNQKQEIEQDFIKITDALKLTEYGSHGNIELNNLGLSKKEREMLKKTFGVKKLSEIAEDKAVSQVLLERLGRTPEQINKIQALGNDALTATKKEILKEMGLSVKDLNAIKEDKFGEYIKTVEEASKKVSGKVKIGAGYYKKLGVFTKPFARTVGCDEVYNKLHSLSKEGAKTATGRFMSKAMQMFHRGLTFGGGKLGALLFIAPALVEVGTHVKKAEKDEKIGTAVSGVIESTSWVLTFPLALKMLHTLGGAQYAGMTKDQVKQVRQLKKEFNDKAGTGGIIDRFKILVGMDSKKECQFKDYADYKKQKAEVKAKIDKLSKVKNQNILTKGIRKLAKFMTIDLENLKAYHGGNFGSRSLKDLPRFLKDGVGIPLRFVVWGVLAMGVLDAVIKKCTTAVFGKSYDAMKHDENDEARKEQKHFLAEDLNRRLYEAQRIKQYGNIQNAQQVNPQGRMMATRGKGVNSDAIPKAYQENEKVDNYTYIPSSKNIIPHKTKKESVDNYTYIPSSECKIPNNKANENQRRYIPSQTAANIQKNFDNSGLQSALDRAQKAEDKALRVLAGNFDNM